MNLRTKVTIEPVQLPSPEATTLIALLDSELHAKYPYVDYNNFKLIPVQFSSGGGVFLLARADGNPVGCGGLRRLDEITGEIKRMYVLPTARGTGVGRLILGELERRARQHTLCRLVLSTGMLQPEAIRLYEHSGFTRIPCPAGHVASQARICMAKALAHGSS